MLARLPGLLLRLEGLAILIAALLLYFNAGFGWVLLVALILAPDLSMAAYLLGPRTGALGYDTLHTEAFPIILGSVGIVADAESATRIALIWLAHIGADRLLGYGLKYPSAFKDTHLQRV
ncbi:MAG TPA: DUF4260 domain-containing protein [Gaiellaceae bacterium]